MLSHISLGPAPAYENCAQVGQPDYLTQARQECERYIAAIRVKIGPEPKGASLKIKSNDHDFGEYLDVIVEYDADDENARAYAFKAEIEAPLIWEEVPVPDES